MADENIKELREFFEKVGWVKLAFLFGSQAKGQRMSESDFDIAVWPEEDSTGKDFDHLWIELERLIKKPVDLISLPTARPTIAWEAFQGIPLLVRDERFYLNKMLEVSSEAEDFQNFVMEVWKAREESKT